MCFFLKSYCHFYVYFIYHVFIKFNRNCDTGETGRKKETDHGENANNVKLCNSFCHFERWVFYFFLDLFRMDF